MNRYQQHCPIARAAELLAESWTLLIVRELVRGSERLSQIAAGVPAMSTTLLRRRLRSLQDADIVTRLPGASGDPAFRLTAAGRELGPIVDGLGRWGQRWLPDPRFDDLHPGLLLHDVISRLDHEALPATPVVVQVSFSDGAPPRRWWLVLGPDTARADSVHPGLTVVVHLDCTTLALARVWLGRSSWPQAIKDQVIRFTGDRAAVHAVIRSLGRSPFADTPYQRLPEDEPADSGPSTPSTGQPLCAR